MQTRDFTVVIHGNEGRLSLRTTTESAVAWISKYSEEIGDFCPRSGKLFIPHCYTRTDLFRVYVVDMRATFGPGTSIVNCAWFGRLMKSRFPLLHLACKLMLGFCDECIRLTEARLKASNDDEKAAYQRAQSLHFELQRAERVSYQRRKLQAAGDPHGCWSVILDFTDSYVSYSRIAFAHELTYTRFLLPQYAPFPKSWVRKFRLGMDCAGLINHATRTRLLFFSLPYYSHNPNLIISLLYYHIYSELIVEKRVHPPELFLQSDNCWREGKNRWVLGYCAWLVMMGIFTKVTLSFLLQGHTHEDID